VLHAATCRLQRSASRILRIAKLPHSFLKPAPSLEVREWGEPDEHAPMGRKLLSRDTLNSLLEGDGAELSQGGIAHAEDQHFALRGFIDVQELSIA
jgi:hypothetical protein